jgi:hypothetical protein
MNPGEAGLLDFLLAAVGATITLSGWRTIRKRRTRTQYGEHRGRGAVRLGWFWLILGILIMLAALTHVPFLKALGRLILRADA